MTPSKLIPLGRGVYHRGFLPEQKLYIEATEPSSDASAGEIEEYEELLKQYEDNCKEHKSQLAIAGELVDDFERLGFRKNAYVFDGAFLDKELMEKLKRVQSLILSRLEDRRCP